MKGIIAVIVAVTIVFTTTGIHAQEPMKFAYFHSFPPYSWNEGSQVKGILIDIVNLIVRDRLNIAVQHMGYPWKRAQSYVEKGMADAFITLPTPERLRYTVAGDRGVILVEMKIFVTKDNPLIPKLNQIQSLSGLKGYRIADYMGNGWIEQNLRKEDGYNIELLYTSDLAYHFLSAGRADVKLDVSHVGRYMLKKLQLSESVVELSKPVVEPYYLKLCVGKKSQYIDIIPKFDKAFREAEEDGSLQNIIDSYTK